MPRSHIHGSPRRFHYRSNLTDDPRNAIFRSPIRMHNGVATGFDVSTKDKIEKEPFGDKIDTVCYSLERNYTCQGVCTADEERFATVQVRVRKDKKGLKGH